MLYAGGANCAAVVATWARVHMRGDMLIVGSALRSLAACHFCMHSCLMVGIGKAVGLLVDALLMGTLGNGVICSSNTLFVCYHQCGICVYLPSFAPSDFVGVAPSALRTRCMGGVSIYVAVCSNLSGCALICTCAVSAICCRSFVAGECLSLPVMPWMLALRQSANACISLSACVMEGLVMHLCWNCTVLNRHLLLAIVFW